MFNGSFLTVCMILQFVKKIRFSLLESGRTKPWCPGLVSRPSAKAQELVARSRGLVIQPQNTQLVHILSFHSQAVVSLFIFPTSPTALDSEPCGRRYIKNMIYNRNRLYSRAIHSPTSMEKHYVQWFILWCLGRVPKHRNHWQEVEGLLFSPKNSQLVHILSFCSQGAQERKLQLRVLGAK